MRLNIVLAVQLNFCHIGFPSTDLHGCQRIQIRIWRIMWFKIVFNNTKKIQPKNARRQQTEPFDQCFAWLWWELSQALKVALGLNCDLTGDASIISWLIRNFAQASDKPCRQHHAWVSYEDVGKVMGTAVSEQGNDAVKSSVCVESKPTSLTTSRQICTIWGQKT